MPNTLHDIKDKLLSALDRDYNVVDMATVIEVISILEKTCITKDALEKTRIGKYVNELRKKTTNDQLARRAKQLVKKWRKLLPVTDHTAVNGERVVGCIGTPPIGMTPSGPGPGPGVGPGPGPGFANKPASPAVGVGNSNTGRFASPAMVSERVASPCSSASSSPHLPASRHQGSNRTSIPSTHVPSKTTGHHVGQSHTTDKIPLLNPALSSAVSNGNSATSNLLFKPVSPALLAIQANSGIKHGTVASGTNPVAHPKLHSPVGSPASLESSSRSRSPCLNITGKTLPSRHRQETHSSAQHPTFSPHSGICHSSLELAKTNAANKRLRKEVQPDRTTKKRCGSDRISPTTVGMVNGMDPALCQNKSIIGIVPSKGSAFESFKAATEPETCVKDSDNRKKKILADHEGIGIGTKLQKVKTTQQLIAELKAKKGGASLPENFRTNNINLSILSKRSGNHVLFGSDADVSKTKLELMDRFLQSSTSDKRQLDAKFERESPTVESIQDDSKFSSENKLQVRVDPITEEINKLMSSLPEIGEVDLSDDDYVYVKPEFTESDSLRIDSEKWEHVNGEYDKAGNWKEWHETTSRESYLGDSLHILPYVNIDW